MKIFKMSALATSGLCAVVLLYSGQTNAQETKGRILEMSAFTIKNGQGMAFANGTEQWVKCYGENGGKDVLNGWWEMNGDASVFVLTSMIPNFAALDDTGDDAGKACRHIAQNLILPYVESSTRGMMRHLPEWSSATMPESSVVWATSFKIKMGMGRTFRDVVKEVQELSGSKELMPHNHWYRAVGGGRDAADYMLVTHYDNFAGMDEEGKKVWEKVRAKLGDEAGYALQDKFTSCLEDSWSHIYKKAKDSSYKPAAD